MDAWMWIMIAAIALLLIAIWVGRKTKPRRLRSYESDGKTPGLYRGGVDPNWSDSDDEDRRGGRSEGGGGGPVK